MRSNFVRFLIFAVLAAALAGGLKLFNWIPLAAQKELMREYGDLDEMKAALNFSHVYVPSYFPQNLAWPPSRILAQRKPYPALVLEFTQAETGRAALVISQAASDDFLPGGAIEIAKVRERTTFSMKGREFLLEVGLGRKGEPCSRVSWREGQVRLTVAGKAPPQEVIRVAESLLREPAPGSPAPEKSPF